MSENTEVDVVYRDGDHGLRRVRGIIIAEDDLFVTLKRRDGEVRLARRIIERIEQWRGDRDGRF